MYPQQQYYQQVVPQTPSGNSKRKLALVALVVLVVVTIILGVVSSLGQSGGGDADKIISSIAKGDSEGSYTMLSREARLTATRDQWTAYVKANQEDFSGKREVVYKQDLAEVKAVEYGINVGESGSITRVTVVVLNTADEGGGAIYSIRANPTTL
jgi:hypothetical protein